MTSPTPLVFRNHLPLIVLNLAVCLPPSSFSLSFSFSMCSFSLLAISHSLLSTCSLVFLLLSAYFHFFVFLRSFLVHFLLLARVFPSLFTLLFIFLYFPFERKPYRNHFFCNRQTSYLNLKLQKYCRFNI